MTPKELLYIEDALSHEKFFQTKCKEAAQMLTDPELRSYVNQLESKHTQLFGQFYNLIQEGYCHG